MRPAIRRHIMGRPATVNTERAGRTGFVFSNLKDWIYELLDFYIERAAEEMRK